MPDVSREGYLRAWAGTHGGHDPAAGGHAERAWFAVMYRLALPLRRVPPDALTLAALLSAAAAAGAAAAGSRALLAAALAVAVSALLDGLDGAVAVLAGRASRWGHLIDSLGDRLAEAAFAAALGLAGAPWQLCAVAVATGWLQEYARARADAGGATGIGVVTVAERPTRVMATLLALLGAGLVPERAAESAAIGAGVWAALGLVGLAQLLPVLRRALR